MAGSWVEGGGLFILQYPHLSLEIKEEDYRRLLSTLHPPRTVLNSPGLVGLLFIL
jgi:hypothetical protein